MADGLGAPPPLQQKIKASGFLWKRGHRVKNWKRRWFILRDAYLAYFEGPTKTNQAPKGVLPIGGCEIAENAFAQTGHSHSFILTTSIGVYMLRCDTQAEAADWLTKLKQSKTLFAGLEKLTGAGQDKSDRKKLFQKIWFEQFRKGLRKSRQSFKRAGFETNLPARVFGVPLQVLVAREGRSRGGVPIWAGRFIDYLESRALRLQGLFRVSGHGDEIAAVRLLIESGEEFHLEARVKDPHSVAALLKLFIRELPEPLVPCNMYEAFLEIPSQTDVPSRVALLRRLASQLPWEHRALLQRLLSLLVRVNDHSADNSMGVQNICICWAPNVLRADEAARADIMQGIRDAPLVLAAFKELIEHYAEIFPASPLGGAGSSGGGAAVGASGSSGGVASMSPMGGSPMNSFSGVTAQSQSHVAVSPLALFADAGASLESQGSPSSSAAESARRKKENRNAKMHVISQGEEPIMPVLVPSITRATSPSPPGRVASPTLQEHPPQNLQPQKLPSLRISLPNESADLPPPPLNSPPAPPSASLPVPSLPPAPASPRSLLRIDVANLPPPPEPTEEPLPQASLSRALLGKMMESFTPREVEEAEAAAAATAATSPSHAPAPSPVSPLSFLPKIVPPLVPPVSPPSPSPSPTSSLSPPSGGWTHVKANRAGVIIPLAHSLRRKDEARDMALLAETSRFIEAAGPRTTLSLAPPIAERLFVEVDAFVAAASQGKRDSPRDK